MQKLGETKMVNSSVPIARLLSVFLPPHPPPLLLQLRSRSPLCKPWVSGGLPPCLVALGARSRDTAWQAGRHYTAVRLPSFLTPIWPSSEPSTKGNYTTGPDCSCRYCFMAELFHPAPSLAFAHTGTLCSTFNRCRKGTLQEINRLPSTDQSYCLSGLSSCPTLDQPTSLLPCCKKGKLHPKRYAVKRVTSTKKYKPNLLHHGLQQKASSPYSIVPSSIHSEATEKTRWAIKWKHLGKFFLLTQSGEKSCHVYPNQEAKPYNQLHIKLTSKTASLMYYVLSFNKGKNSSEVLGALLFEGRTFQIVSKCHVVMRLPPPRPAQKGGPVLDEELRGLANLDMFPLSSCFSFALQRFKNHHFFSCMKMREMWKWTSHLNNSFFTTRSRTPWAKLLRETANIMGSGDFAHLCTTPSLSSEDSSAL